MRVAVDARYGLMANRRGIGVATYHLLRAWRELEPDNLEVLAYGDDRMDPAVASEFRDSVIAVKRLSARPFALWEQWALPRAAARDRADLIHALANVGPLRPSAPMVVSMHDVIEWHRGKDFDGELSSRHRLSRLYRMNAMALNARRARAIHTVSQHAAEDIHRTLRVPEDKIHVIALGFAVRTDPADESILRELNLTPGAYAMAFGALDPRKNSELLLRLWAGRQMPWDLVLVGAEPHALRRWQPRFGAIAGIHLRGFESDSRVRALMQHAAVFLYPSSFEGFGLPVLEALAEGVPVVLTERTAGEEVARGAVLTVEDASVDAWTAALLRVARDRELQQRLRLHGPPVAASYTWDHTARHMVDLYRTVRTAGPNRGG